MEFLYLFTTAFISATFFPLGSEGLLVYYLSQSSNPLYLLLFATLGNTLGSVLNYYLGYKGEEYLEKKQHIKPSSMKRYKSFFGKYGAWSLLFSWAPVVGDPITFMAGVFNYPLKRFIILVAFAKATRYAVVIGIYYFF